MITRNYPFGPELKAIRVLLGMNQDEMAARLGITQAHVSRLEAGKPGEVSEKLAAALRSLREERNAIAHSGDGAPVRPRAPRQAVAFKVEPGPRGGKTIQIENPDIADDVLKLIQLYGAASPADRQAMMLRLQHPSLMPPPAGSGLAGLSDDAYEAIIRAAVRAFSPHLTRVQEQKILLRAFEVREKIGAGSTLAEVLAEVAQADDIPANESTSRGKTPA